MSAVSELVETGNLIGGDYCAAAAGRTFESRNPAHKDDVVGVFPRSDAGDVDAAVKVARAAFDDWRRTPWPARAAIILRASEMLEERKEELARLMTREMGKVLTEARGDVQEAIDMGKFIAGEGRRAFGETVPSELRDKWAMTMRQPFGVVGCITPWNFPMAIPSWKIFPAVMAGNTVVLKPAEDTPLCALRFVEVLEAAGLPGGVVNVVFGFGEEAGAALVEHPDVAAIYFTGSVDTGRIVSETCGRMLKKCSLELGGKNAIVVLDDADIPLAVDGALWGAFGTSGQRCTASSRLIVEKGALDGFTSQLVERAGALRLGDGLDSNVDVGPVINETQLRRIELVHRYRSRRGCLAPPRGRDRHHRRSRQRMVLPPHRLRRRRSLDADRAGGDLRTDHGDHAGRIRRGSDRGGELHAVRAESQCLHQRPAHGVPCHQRIALGNRVHQRADDRCGDPAPVRRDSQHRQRPPRSRRPCARRVQRVEVNLHRLQRTPPARADRHGVTSSVNGLEERFTKHEGEPLRYLTGGSGPPLLLCHGFIGSAENFTDWFDVLLSRRTIIAPDLPGFGRSAPMVGGHTVPALARAALTAANDAGVDHFDVAGLCLGSPIALAVQRARPQATGRLILHTPLVSPELIRRLFHIQVGIMLAPFVYPCIVWLAHQRTTSDIYKRFMVEGKDVDPVAATANFENQLLADPRAAREWLYDVLRRRDLAQVREVGASNVDPGSRA